MALTLQECIEKIKKEYPKHYPYTFIEVNGKYIFNIVQKGYDPHKAISDMHVVDPDTGFISGGISIMEFIKDPSFREKWKKPNLVANHEESVSHSSLYGVGKGKHGYGVRKIQNGSDSDPFERSASEVSNGFTYGGSLSHHGIKGQSWGTRNGPPYPLDQKTHNKVVKNASKVGNGSAKYDSEGGARTGLIPELVTLATLVGVNLYLSNPKVIDRKKNKKQQKYYEGNKALSEDLLGDMVDMDKQFSDDNPPKLITGKHSIEDDMLACNPRYKDGVVPGTSSNCTLCAFTYDMRRRGYDVAALASETGNYSDQVIKDLYKDAKVDNIKARNFTDMFKKAAEKYPEGARGELHLTAPFFAHSMAWEIKDHQLVVIDPQRNEKHTAQQLQEYGFYSNNDQNGFIRTDNLEVNMPGINRVCAEYKSNGLKTAKSERAKSSSSNADSSKSRDSKAAAGGKKLSEAERMRNYRELYLKEHPNADPNSKAVQNWVDAQMNK